MGNDLEDYLSSLTVDELETIISNYKFEIRRIDKHNRDAQLCISSYKSQMVKYENELLKRN